MKVKITEGTCGNLTVIGLSSHTDKKQHAFWVCRCISCGRKLEVRGDNLRRGTSTGCSECNNGKGRPSRYLTDD